MSPSASLSSDRSSPAVRRRAARSRLSHKTAIRGRHKPGHRLDKACIAGQGALAMHWQISSRRRVRREAGPGAGCERETPAQPGGIAEPGSLSGDGTCPVRSELVSLQLTYEATDRGGYRSAANLLRTYCAGQCASKTCTTSLGKSEILTERVHRLAQLLPGRGPHFGRATRNELLDQHVDALLPFRVLPAARIGRR